MGGETLASVELEATGVARDRLYALESEAAPPGMLRVTGWERRELLRYRAVCSDDEVLVDPPAGSRFNITQADLIAQFPGFSHLRLTHSARPQTDCRPLSLIGLETIRLLGEKLGHTLDGRRFRANLYLNTGLPFLEDAWVGRRVRIGGQAVIRILERDPRCRFITLDPDTTEPMPELMRLLHREHGGRAGVYASVEVPGTICVDAPVTPLE